jgi:hypothetical protein
LKKLIECISCGKLTAYYKSYKVGVTRPIAIPGVPVSKQPLDTYEGRLCRNCYKSAGYKVKGEKNERNRH